MKRNNFHHTGCRNNSCARTKITQNEWEPWTFFLEFMDMEHREVPGIAGRQCKALAFILCVGEDPEEPAEQLSGCLG